MRTRAPFWFSLTCVALSTSVFACRQTPRETTPETKSETPTDASPKPLASASEGVSPVTIDHDVVTLAGKPEKLSSYRGKALLIVNTASECGYTPQYAGLEALYEKYKDRGLVVLGFPCNDFGGQEPGDEQQVATFCQKNYGVTFPMFAKVHAKGPEQAPLYKTLTQDTGAGITGEVKWNFTKFLVDPQGKVVARFEPKVEPMAGELVAAVEKVLPPK